MRQTYTPAEVAALLGLSASRVRALVRAGTLDARRPGSPDGHIRIPVVSVRRYLVTAGYSLEKSAVMTEEAAP